MGVDFYSCALCGDTFPDCGEYVTCTEETNSGCGRHWCSLECAKKDGYRTKKGMDRQYEIEVCSCKYCRNEEVDDSKLVEHLLKLLGVTRKEAVTLYFESNKP